MKPVKACFRLPTAEPFFLRVLQQREIRMVGSTQTQSVLVRVIAATNSDLLALIRNGSFREDLYYRLNVIDIETPPLRERKQDIDSLTTLFLKKYGAEYGKPDIEISPDAMQLLKRHAWPGNIRELENVIQRLIILGEDHIGIRDLPDHFKYSLPPGNDEPVSLREAEKAHIQKILASVDGNKTKAAEILGIDRKTLRQKLL